MNFEISTAKALQGIENVQVLGAMSIENVYFICSANPGCKYNIIFFTFLCFVRNALLTRGEEFAERVSSNGILKIITESFSSVSVFLLFLASYKHDKVKLEVLTFNTTRICKKLENVIFKIKFFSLHFTQLCRHTAIFIYVIFKDKMFVDISTDRFCVCYRTTPCLWSVGIKVD